MNDINLNPYSYIPDVTGDPLDLGYVYIGQPGLDPVLNPKTVYWDNALTFPITQPIRTIYGRVFNAGSMAEVFAAGDFSIRVLNRNGALVFSALNAGGLRADLAASSGSSLIGFIAAGAGAVAQTLQDKNRQTVSIEDFGAVGDFDPTTGVGTDNRVAIQKALTYAMTTTGCKVRFTSRQGGNYYLGTGYTDAAAGVQAQLMLGTRGVVDSAKNIILENDGATLYQGAPGLLLGITNAFNIDVEALRMFGYVGGVLSAARMFDRLISVMKNSKHVRVKKNYLTNCLGWAVEVTGDPTVAGAGTGFTCLDVNVHDNVIKTRYGNGTSAAAGGSKSLWALAAIDVQGLSVKRNTVYGIVDLEPNLSGQYLSFIDVQGNRFESGYVTPVVPAGVSTYWADEAIGLYDGGGTVLVQGVNLAGAAGAPKCVGNVIADNLFDYGTITGNNGPYKIDIRNNEFRKGKIILGDTSGGNTNNYFTCAGNKAFVTTDGAGGFIKLNGDISYAEISENTLKQEALPCVYDTAPGNAGDSGNLKMRGNTSPLYGGFALNVSDRGGNAAFSDHDGNFAGNSSLANPTNWHSGGLQPAAAATGTDSTPVVTETYICEVFIAKPGKITGVSLLNGSAVAGNIHLGIAKADGTVLAQSASRVQAGTAGYQQVALTAPLYVEQPGKYFILAQFDNVGARFRTHILGNFGASKKTGETYGTFTTITPPTSFTTNLGPIADMY